MVSWLKVFLAISGEPTVLSHIGMHSFTSQAQAGMIVRHSVCGSV
jgi:hypothetical protein